MGAVPREPLPIRFRLDGRPLGGETLCLDAGAREGLDAAAARLDPYAPLTP